MLTALIERPPRAAAVAVFFVGSALLGKQILNFFNVGLDDFRIAGGLLALMIALEMFQAQYGRFIQVADETGSRRSGYSWARDHALCFSAACRTGRTSIMITLSNDNLEWLAKTLLAAASVPATFLIGLTLWTAAAIERLLGRTGINVMTRHGPHRRSDRREFHDEGIRSELPGLTGQ
jgi:multiple antibiotic resistance protein